MKAGSVARERLRPRGPVLREGGGEDAVDRDVIRRYGGPSDAVHSGRHRERPIRGNEEVCDVGYRKGVRERTAEGAR
jgi:hypothetical protein